MIEVKAVSKEYNGKEILSGISFSIQKGDKVAIVGPNGVGKSTLLKTMTGEQFCDQGEVVYQDDLVIGYLPQDFKYLPSISVKSFLWEYSGLSLIESALKAYEKNESNDEAEGLIYSNALNEFNAKGGYSFDHTVAIMLEGFDLDPSFLGKDLQTLSVGQKAKVFLTGILLKKPDVVLLDEPTNNLDLPSIIWLEEYLKRQITTVVMVSHDVKFLDAIINKVAYIDPHHHTLDITRGKFSDYLDRLHKDLNRKNQEYQEFTQEKDRLLERASDLKAKTQKGSNFKGSDNDKFARGFKRDRAGRSGKQAKNLEKQIEQMEIKEKPIEKKELQITISPDVKGSSIQCVDLIAGYSTFKVGPVNLTVPFGAKIAFIGANGSGKSTLLNSLTNKSLVLSGVIHTDSKIIIGNLTQQHEILPDEKTIIEFLRSAFEKPDKELYSLLVKHGFNAEAGNKKIGVISPGERARLLFALFSGLKVNTLLLDEPTNHLDIEAMEALTVMLESYEGTIILVTHDRSLLEKKIVNDLYLIEEGKISYLTNYQEYVDTALHRVKKLLRLL
jgi:ATP-binding cassette subfamily F protein 3